MRCFEIRRRYFSKVKSKSHRACDRFIEREKMTNRLATLEAIFDSQPSMRVIKVTAIKIVARVSKL